MSLPLPNSESEEEQELQSKIDQLNECFVVDGQSEEPHSLTPGVAQIVLSNNSEPRKSRIENVRESIRDVIIGIRSPKQRVSSQYDNLFLQWLDNFFRISTLNSKISTEIIGGFTSYFVTAYILFANPSILSITGMDSNALYVVTAVVSGLGTLAMGLIAKVPIVIAPAMGMNSFIAYTIVSQVEIPWQTVMGMTVVAGILNFFVILFGVREKLILALPEYYRIGLAVGIALFLAMIGAESMQLIQSSPATILTLGDLNWRMGVGLLCLVLMACLILRNIRLAFVVAIVVTSVVIVVVRAIFFRDQLTFDVNQFTQLDISPIAFKLNFNFNLKALYIVPLILFFHVFDSLSTALVILRQAYLSSGAVELKSEDIENSLASSSKVRSILLIDSIFFIISGVLGTSASTPFVESATGVAIGAKTGLCSIVTGLLFIVSIFLKPIVQYIAPQATGPALIITALLLIPFLKHLNFTKYEELFPALFTMIMIPLSYSIGNGAAFGYAFIITWVFVGKWRKITPVMWVLMVLSYLQILSNIFHN